MSRPGDPVDIARAPHTSPVLSAGSRHRETPGPVQSLASHGAEAQAVPTSDRYADVRQAEQIWQSRGIRSVPAIVINDRYLISGGQPPETFAGTAGDRRRSGRERLT